MYKKGFTIIEVLVCFIIIGIIFVLSVNTVRTVNNSYTALAYFAHNNILNVVNSLYSGITNNILKYEGSILPPIITTCTTTEGNLVSVFKTDGELNSVVTDCAARNTSVENANLFCKSLVSLLNIKGSYDCETLYNVGKTRNEPFVSALSFKHPNFTLTNGMRFYLSKWDFDSENVSSTYGYRLIGVDLNGTKGPNKINTGSATDITPSDLVTFLVLDNGEVYPLGLAADNLEVSVTGKTLRYLTTRLKGYYFSDNNLRNTMPKECRGGEKCNFGVVPLGAYNYRTSFCSAKKETGIEYTKYCSDIAQNELCPPSASNAKFDMCSVDIIKPAFRFDF